MTPKLARTSAETTNDEDGDSGPKKWHAFGLWCCVLCLTICARVYDGVRSDQETRERIYGNMPNGSSADSNNTLTCSIASSRRISPRMTNRKFRAWRKEKPLGPGDQI